MNKKRLILSSMAFTLCLTCMMAQTETYDFEAMTQSYYEANEETNGIDTKVFNSTETLQFNNNTYTILEEKDGYAEFSFGGRFAVEYSDDSKKGLTSPRFELANDVYGLYNCKRWPKLVVMNLEVGDRLTIDFVGDIAPRNSASALITDDDGVQVTDMLDAANKTTGSMVSGFTYTVSRAGHLPLYFGYGTSGVTIQKIVIAKSGLSDEEKEKAAALSALTDKIVEGQAELEAASQEGLYGDAIFQYSIDLLLALDNAILNGQNIAAATESGTQDYVEAAQAIDEAISSLTVNAPSTTQAYSLQSTNGVGEKYLDPTNIANGKAAMSETAVGLFFAPVAGERNQFYISFLRENATLYLAYVGADIVEAEAAADNARWQVKPQADGALIIAQADGSSWLSWPNSTAEQTNTLNKNTWNNQWRVAECDNTATVIASTGDSRTQATPDLYDLTGRKMAAKRLPRGLYIAGNKKVIIK